MAVFFDTGGGDIYGGPTREAVIAAMRADLGGDLDESDVFEVPGTMKMRVTDENECPTVELIAIEEEFGDSETACCVASENC